MRRALAWHDALLRQAIEGAGGHVFTTMGDSFHAVFRNAPAALEAALEAQRTLAGGAPVSAAPAHPSPLTPHPSPFLRVRMAIHTGPAEPRDGDYAGPTVERLERILSAAHGGQLL